MLELTESQKDELTDIAAKDADMTVNDVIRYYEILKNAGSVYAAQALSVVIEGNPHHPRYSQYTTVQGKFGNAFSWASAYHQGVSFHVGGDAWRKMQRDLLKIDWGIRKDNPSRELTRVQIEDNHSLAFASVGLPPTVFTTKILLSQIGRHSCSRAEELWHQVVGGQTFSEMFGSGMRMLFDKQKDSTQSLKSIFNDYRDKFLWTKNATEALVKIGYDRITTPLSPAKPRKVWHKADFF